MSPKSLTNPTTDEYFFAYKGSGTYVVDKEQLQIQEGDIIRIPANTPHDLSTNDSDETLKIVYFGIATK